MFTSPVPSQRKSFPFFIKVIAFLLCFILSFEQTGFAQVASQLDLSGSINNAVNSFSSAFFRPTHLRYISYDKINQSFKIILNNGDTSRALGVESAASTRIPLKFFYIGLAIPNQNFWVNLRPDSPDQIIDDYLAKTDVGKILLEADLELKKDLARATFPSSAEGKEYWEKIYNKIEEVYGYGLQNTPVSINTRIWITPGEVVICQDPNSAYVYKAGLKVATEAAYLSNKQGDKNEDERSRIINQYSSQLMEKLILPKIFREVNTGKKYASLRQVYYSLILAQWFKQKFYGAGGLYPYLIDRSNLNGLTSNKRWSKNTYFKEYQKSIREKEYDLQVQVFNLFGRAVRTYSTGGVDFTGILAGVGSAKVNVISSSSFTPPVIGKANLFEVNIQGRTLEEPYFGQAHSAAASQEEVSLPILGPVTVKQQDSSRVEIKSPSFVQNALQTEGRQSWGAVLNNSILKILFSPAENRPLSWIGKALTSMPRPVLKLMFIFPIVGTLLLAFYSTASAFSITADVANGNIKDLVFTFQPWENSPDPANETLSGIGQIIGEARGLEGDALMDFIYNQFIPEMKPILAGQGISDVNIIRDGEQIKIPAKFLEGLTLDNVQGVVNSLHHHGWTPLSLEVNTVPANVVPEASLPQHSDVTATPEESLVSPSITPAATHTPDATATVPTLAQPQHNQDFFAQAIDWANHNQPALIIAGTVALGIILFFVGRAVYTRIRNAQRAKQQEKLDGMLKGNEVAQGILEGTNSMIAQARATNQPPVRGNVPHNNTDIGPTDLGLSGQKQAKDSVAQGRLEKLRSSQNPQAPPESQPSTSVPASSATPRNKEINEDELDATIERLQASPRKYLQALFNSKRINIRERIRFIADELGFDILNGQGVSLLVRNPETLRRNREFLEGLALPVNVTNLKASKISFVVRELVQIVKYSQWQQLTNQEKLAVVSYLFDVYGLRSSWVARDQAWVRLLERFNLNNTPIDYSSRAIDFIQQYELARYIRYGQPRRTEIRLSKIQEIVEIMGLKVAQSLEQAKTPEGFQLYVAKANQGSEAVDKLPAVEAAPQSYTEHLDQSAGLTDGIVNPEATESLTQFESIYDTKITALQIQTALNILLHSFPGESNYEHVRSLIRHIHPDDFLRIKKMVKTNGPFVSNQLLQERFDLIVLERPSELSVGLVRSISKIHDWEELLKHSALSREDLAKIIACCEKIIEVLPLRLIQETNDQIGSINKVTKQSYKLILKTMNKLLKQQGLDKELYGENVSILLGFGYYFADYQSALGYLQDLDTAKKYQYDGQEINGNGNGNGNGQSHPHKAIRYNLWHKLTAVPAIENNAMKNLDLLLPLLNTEGNELTTRGYFAKLTPTRIGSSQFWWLRKPVSVFISLALSSISLLLFIFGAPVDPTSSLFILKGILILIGFASLPLVHYGFAKIGAISEARFLKKLHSQIKNLEVSWNTTLPLPRIRIKIKPRDNSSKPSLSSPEIKLVNETVRPSLIEEDHAVEGALVTRQDVEAIAELADLLEIKPVDLPQIDRELEKLFGAGRVFTPVIRIMPQVYMLTKDGSKINRPIRLGNQIFMGDEYFAAHQYDFQGLLADLAHEQMAQ